MQKRFLPLFGHFKNQTVVAFIHMLWINALPKYYCISLVS